MTELHHAVRGEYRELTEDEKEVIQEIKQAGSDFLYAIQDADAALVRLLDIIFPTKEENPDFSVAYSQLNQAFGTGRDDQYPDTILVEQFVAVQTAVMWAVKGVTREE